MNVTGQTNQKIGNTSLSCTLLGESTENSAKNKEEG